MRELREAREFCIKEGVAQLCIMNPALIRYLVALLMTVIAMSAHGQEPGDGYTRIKGVVTDSVTGEGIPYAQIFLIGSQTGALTNDHGGFTIVTGVDFEKLQVTAVGYMSQEIVVPIGEYTELDIKLARHTRLMILGDWISQFTYAVYDGEHMFLEEYVEGESQP